MAPTAITLSIRFVVIAALYVIVTSIWTAGAHGWESLGLLVASILLGLAAVPAWGAAVVVGQFIENRVVRLIAHPVLMTGLFLFIAVAAGFVTGSPPESAWRDLQPFALLIVVIALADATIGLLLESWLALHEKSRA